jgi:eukaryotic-like serine/threonine-protein kinase
VNVVDQERWSRAKVPFHDAIEVPPERRGTFLASACGPDTALLDEVRSLVTSDADAGEFIEEPAAALLADSGERTTPVLSEGDRLGRYEVLEYQGSGAVGEVYRARDTRLGRTVALKVLTHRHAPNAGASLLREAQHASMLNHPHVCTVHEVDEVDAWPFIVLEHIEGTTLHGVIGGQPMPVERVARWAGQIADALDHAHHRGIIHRDLKSSNVIVMPGGDVKVLDFGLSRRLAAPADGGASAMSVLADASVAGTLTHIAPEVFRGDAVDGRIDIWALGVMLHEMLTGTVPFHGRTPFETANAILGDEAPPLPVQVPARLRLVIGRCLSKDPAARYRTAAEVRDALATVAAGVTKRPQGRRRRAIVAAGVAVAVAGGLYATGSWRAERPWNEPQTRMLAVLPFQDTSGNAADRVLADGMTEAMIAELGRIDAVRVMAPTTSQRLRERAGDLRQVGRDTGATQVLEASVARSDDRVRLTARLIETTSGRILWSADYERHTRELQALYGVIAAAVAAAVEVGMDADDARRLSLIRSVDPDVYEAFLKGRYYWNQRTSDSLRTAVAQFETAIALDPSYAPAYAALADCYNQLGTQMVGGGSPQEWRPRAADAAMRALRIDATLAEAHATLGYVQHYDWQWTTAEQSFRRAIALNPSYALARIWYANLLSSQNRVDEAISQVTVAAELDPLSPVVATNVGWVYTNAHRFTEAIEHLTRTVAMDPGYVQAHSRLGAAYSNAGRHDEAVAELETAVRLSQGRPSDRAALAQGLGLAGRSAEALRIVEELVAGLPTQYVSPGALANAYIALGRREDGLRWLERSHRERTNNNAYLGVEPVYDVIREEPRFQALMRAVGLP